MAQRIELADITIPPGVLASAPQTFTLNWREGYPEFIELRFPPGPSGLVGLQVFHSGTRIIPKRGNGFVVADNETIRWELQGFAYNAVYTVRAYNTGSFEHTIQVRIGLNELGRQEIVRAPVTLPPLPIVSPGELLEGLER